MAWAIEARPSSRSRARDLRAQGWTLSEICEELGVARSSASVWCRDVAIDEAVLAERRRKRFLVGNEGARQRGPNKLQRRKQAEIERLRAEGIERIGQLTEQEFLVAGVALYAGEGSKRDGTSCSPTPIPRMLLFFLAWLRRFFDVDECRLAPAPLPPRGAGSRRSQQVLVRAHRDSRLSVREAVPSGCGSDDPRVKASDGMSGRRATTAPGPIGAIIGLDSGVAILRRVPFRGSTIGGAGAC